MRRNLVADLLEARRAVIDAVHLVDHDRNLVDAEQMQQIAVAAGLVAHAFRASMISTAPSACEAPVIMLRRNSAWPGASIRMTSRDGVRKRICVVSMVMPWSRSVCSASSRNDHSNGMPRRALTAFSISSLPSGRLPVSCSSRPTSVDLP